METKLEKEPHWASNKRLFLFNQFAPNGILMFPDFHRKLWLPELVKTGARAAPSQVSTHKHENDVPVGLYVATQDKKNSYANLVLPFAH